MKEESFFENFVFMKKVLLGIKEEMNHGSQLPSEKVLAR